MTLTTESSTVDTSHSTYLTPDSEKREGFYKVIFPFVEASTQYAPPITPAYPVFKCGTESTIVMGSSTAVYYSGIAFPQASQWFYEPFASKQAWTKTYYTGNEGGDTFVGFERAAESSFDNRINIALENLFASLENEGFDTDPGYYLTNGLQDLFEKNGKRVVSIVSRLITQYNSNHEYHTACEILKAMGRTTDEKTKADRFTLLTNALESEVPIIRDGAILGLSFMDDKAAISILRVLLEGETIPVLRENIKVAIKDLEAN